MAITNPHLAKLTSTAMLLGSLNAFGQTMDFSCPPPGTKFTFSIGGTVIVKEQKAVSCLIESSRLPGVSQELYALLYPFDDARRRDPSWKKYIDPIQVEKIWPLSVGKSHFGEAVLADGTYSLTYKVLRSEVIDSAMGPQEAFVLELRETSTNGYSANAKWWISTRFKYPIKYEFGDSRGRTSGFTITAVQLP